MSFFVVFLCLSSEGRLQRAEEGGEKEILVWNLYSGGGVEIVVNIRHH